ncbi:MAG: hypothetical protein ABGX23_00225 [Nautiliaceae bacterium]
MKKVIGILFLVSFLFSSGEFCFYTIKMDYREYQNGRVLDRDYTDFGELVGIGYRYENSNFYDSFFRIEGAYGGSHYEGATWGGKPIKENQSGVYILNIEGGFGQRGVNFILGYRFWNRGKSNSIGDYNEQYYWPYYGVMWRNCFEFRKFSFKPEIAYQKAINPQMKAYLGNEPVIDLGDTEGFKAELPLYFKSKNFSFKLFYRYQLWHVSASSQTPLLLNGKVVYIYEPESFTRNSYIGAGISFCF